MKATKKNHIRLWWHCLIHFHCQYFVQIPSKGMYSIGCFDCDYGTDELINQTKPKFMKKDRR